MKISLVNVAVKPVRLLSKIDAADYCCRSVRRFVVECPVSPLVMANGDHVFDIRDLDNWIDGLKSGDAHDAASMALDCLR